ncbi:MAG: anti-anti-sigma factor [Acidobacteria bacterium]|nr:MAG: anti-anti-sigma factor [Acidobacteriota bacterium]
MEVPILKQGEVLIATFQAALSDADLEHLRRGLVQQVVKLRSRGVIVDVTAMDVMDSFASRTLREIAHMIRLRGAETVIVGIQPEVAFAMVQLGLTLEDVVTALDLEEGLAYLTQKFKNTD